MEQVVSRNGAALFAFLCPTKACRDQFIYLASSDDTGELFCPSCGRVFWMEAKDMMWYTPEMAWEVNLYERV